MVIDKRINNSKVNLGFEITEPVTAIADFNNFFSTQKELYKTAWEFLRKSSAAELNSVLTELKDEFGKCKKQNLNASIAKLKDQILQFENILNDKPAATDDMIEMHVKILSTNTSLTLEDTKKYDDFKKLCNALYAALAGSAENCISENGSIEKLVLPTLLQLLKVSLQEVAHEYLLVEPILYTNNGIHHLSEKGKFVEAIKKIFENRFSDGNLDDSKLVKILNSDDSKFFEKYCEVGMAINSGMVQIQVTTLIY